MPTIDPSAYIHASAVVVGNVTIGARVSSGHRRDSRRQRCDHDRRRLERAGRHHRARGQGVPTTIGKRVAIGHRAIVHGATIEDDVLIAMARFY